MRCIPLGLFVNFGTLEFTAALLDELAALYR